MTRAAVATRAAVEREEAMVVARAVAMVAAAREVARVVEVRAVARVVEVRAVAERAAERVVAVREEATGRCFQGPRRCRGPPTPVPIAF